MITSPRQQMFQRLSKLGPYLVLALVLPGGSFLLALLWFYQHKHGKA